MVYSIAAIKKKIRELDLRPTRANGQNFIIAVEPLRTMIAVAEVKSGEQILEIGPGLGALTAELLKVGARVIAVESDTKLTEHLQRDFARQSASGQLIIIPGDARSVANNKFLANLGKYKIVANIPYYITSELIKQFTDTPYPPARMTLLMQQEVAMRVTAAPPDMNLLAFFTQWFARVQYVERVAKNLFWPEPIVDSAIVNFQSGAGAVAKFFLTPLEQRKLFSFVKKGFSHPRKQLGNNLGLDANERARLVNFDWCRRAETLAIDEWITILKNLS